MTAAVSLKKKPLSLQDSPGKLPDDFSFECICPAVERVYIPETRNWIFLGGSMQIVSDGNKQFALAAFSHEHPFYMCICVKLSDFQ